MDSSLHTPPAVTPFLTANVLSGMIVDMFLRPSATNHERNFPLLKELRSYLNSLDSVLWVLFQLGGANDDPTQGNADVRSSSRIVYHRKRAKRLTKPDHIYVVFKTHVDADAFTKGWSLDSETKPFREQYMIQRNPDYPGALLYELHQEIELFLQAFDSEHDKEPDRFRGPAFALLGPFESRSIQLPAFLREKRNLSKEDGIGGTSRRLADLEGRVEALRDELVQAEGHDEERVKELAELEAKLRCYQKKFSRYTT
ncbi:hypothetical protein RSOL_116480 [Rhizoctonia solani AG-3 Rhs1AP]|uniref:Uncharacterized protein n=1 Tax=Rhizoctonia solani AG-3 Rhs1AP TaxID=1086054 RepID=X8J2G2_9AGAM|nr:hypothetical protein RSOL_116480 [Rhizoctonia solani AG-3 Rhs1AP]